MQKRIVAACMCEGCSGHEGLCWNTHDASVSKTHCPSCADREVTCKTCGRSVTFLKDGFADRNYGNACSIVCAGGLA